MTKTNLKECPLCGGGAKCESEYIPAVFKDGWYVKCNRCGLKTRMYHNEREAVIAWNMRYKMRQAGRVVAKQKAKAAEETAKNTKKEATAVATEV